MALAHMQTGSPPFQTSTYFHFCTSLVEALKLLLAQHEADVAALEAGTEGAPLPEFRRR
nr:hypothetical protein [uncultured Rhodopila sp.]